jgi:hypothetical protein
VEGLFRQGRKQDARLRMRSHKSANTSLTLTL